MRTYHRPKAPRLLPLSYKAISAVWAALVAMSGVAAPQQFALAQQNGVVEAPRSAMLSRNISMGVGKTFIVDLPRDAAEIVIGNPKVVNAVVRSPRKLYIMAVEAGQTTIFAVDQNERQIANLEISVGRDVGELGPLLKTALPRSNIVARTVNDTIILTGTVTSAGEASRAVDIAKGFAAKVAAKLGAGGGSGGQEGMVVNALTIRGDDQVMLKVTVAEVERKVIKQLGFSAQAGGETLLRGGWGALVQENPFAVNPTMSGSALTIKGPNSTTATLKAFERYGVSRVLAEPSVTAVSGESAKLMVGGEIAVPGGSSCIILSGSTQQTCSPSIVYKPYGVALSFTPIVLSEGRIQLHLSTEVTEIDLQSTFTYAQIAVQDAQE
jgi:pilus assembly protein CpaC